MNWNRSGKGIQKEKGCFIPDKQERLDYYPFAETSFPFRDILSNC